MAQDFITKFHKIQGESIGERQKNLNTFLKNISIIPEEKEFILDHLHPKTYLENLFYIDILIYFKETSRLLEIFKDGYGAYVSKIMKQPWFFQEAFTNIAPKELVYDFLPLVSFSIKIKLLRNLQHFYNENEIDQVFDYIVDRYGLSLAETLLTSCSSEKIAGVLNNYKIKLSTHQLKMVYRKDPNLIDIYLHEQKQYYNGNIFDNNFLTYLAQSNPVYFWELTEKQQIGGTLKLGRRTTKKVLPTKLQDVVNDPHKYVNYFRHETLVRKLNKKGCFKQFYSNIFPTEIDVFRNHNLLCNTLLKYYPRGDQYNLFMNTFNDIVKEDIFNYTNYIQDDLLEIITDAEIREAWARLKLKESLDEKYLKYYEIKNSIPLIKKKINTTASIRSRSKLISLLVESCAVNKDLQSLEEVLKYFCARHKNDVRFSRVEFLQAIDNHFKFEEFTTLHWKYIMEIIHVHRLNKEYEFYTSKFRIKHIEYLFNNNGPEEDKTHFILEYAHEQMQHCSLNFNDLDNTNNSEIQKTVLSQLIEHIDSMIKQYNSDCHIKCQLIGKIFLFNSKYPEKRINIEENKMLMEYLNVVLKGNEFIPYLFQLYLPKVIRKLNRSDLENELLEFYFRNKQLRLFNFDDSVCWFLRHDPMVIVNHSDLEIETSRPIKRWNIWNTIKKYSHISLDDKIVNQCLDRFENEKDSDRDDKKWSAFAEALSVIGSPECYIKTIENLDLIPTSSKVAIEDEEARKRFQIQKIFLKNFTNVWDPLKYLSLVIDKFSQGDYLRESLGPLHLAFHKIPENKLEVYLDKFAANKAMSVKKHGLYLVYVFDQKKVMQIFNTYQENKNESLQKCLCISSLRYFIKVQTHDFFEKLLAYLNFLNVLDTESLEILSSVQIPKKFKPHYIVRFWELLEKLKTNPNAIGFNKLMSKVLTNVDNECLVNLPEDFCKSIINKYFTTNLKKGEEIDNIFEFIIQFLLNHKSQADNFNIVFLLLSNFKTQFRDLNGKDRGIICKFFDAFFATASREDVDLEFVTKFSTEWEKVFPESEKFKEHILLNILTFKKETKGNVGEYLEHIVHFAEQINNTYGEFIFSKFIAIIAEYRLFGNELLTEILKYKTSTLTCILVMELLSINGDLFYVGGIRPKYREIVSILKQINDPRVQLFYNLFTKSDYI